MDNYWSNPIFCTVGRPVFLVAWFDQDQQVHQGHRSTCNSAHIPEPTPSILAGTNFFLNSGAGIYSWAHYLACCAQ